MAGMVFALGVALVVVLACAGPQAAAPGLGPLPDATVPAAVTPTAGGAVAVTVSLTPSVPPTLTVAIRDVTRVVPTAAVPADTVAPRESPTPPPPSESPTPPPPLESPTPPPPPLESPTPPPPAGERADPTATPMPSATASAPPGPTATRAEWPEGSTPIAEMGLTLSEAVAEIARRYRVSPERVGYQKYATTILNAEVAPAPDSQDLILTVTTRLRNYRNLPDGFKITTFDDSVWVTIYEFDFYVDALFLREGNPASIVTKQIRLKSRLDGDGKRIDRTIYINGQPLLERSGRDCSDYEYGECPVGCVQRACITSCISYNNGIAKCNDCDEPGICYSR